MSDTTSRERFNLSRWALQHPALKPLLDQAAD